MFGARYLLASSAAAPGLLFLPARSHPSCFKFSGYERIVPPLSGATLLHHHVTDGPPRRVAEPEVFDLPIQGQFYHFA